MTKFIIMYLITILTPLIFIFINKFKFIAILLSCFYLVFFSLEDAYFLITNDDLWGLFQVEFQISKNKFIIYKFIFLLLFVILLFISYKFKKTRIIVFLFFTICNILSPLGLLEELIFG